MAIYVLFLYPQPGVADQGDFDRVMNVSGLKVEPQFASGSDSPRFLKYTITDYDIAAINPSQLLNRITATSMCYPITLISLICKLCGQQTFRTTYLAVFYLLVYIFSLWVILYNLKIDSALKFLGILAMVLLVFLDGNYLIWFNSLYGEPMMITTLLLFIAAWINYSNKSKPIAGLFLAIMLVFITAFLFIGSKLQVISALPVLLLLLAKLLTDNRKYLKNYQLSILCLFYVIIIIYPVNLNLKNKDINRDTQYDSVFYGILKNSYNPAEDLTALNLDPDLAVESGKHSFLDRSQYVQYAPHTEITREKFYSQISNGKLIKYYLTHPARLLNGMKYTASQAFYTSTTLGKYPQSYSEKPISDFDRFIFWSSLRGHQLPRSLLFIGSILASVMAISIHCFKNTDDQAVRSKILLLWGVVAIGILQFPMPFVGNGEADTAKQLFLFNFIFDIILVFLAFCFWSVIVDFSAFISSFTTNKIFSRAHINRINEV